MLHSGFRKCLGSNLATRIFFESISNLCRVLQSRRSFDVAVLTALSDFSYVSTLKLESGEKKIVSRNVSRVLSEYIYSLDWGQRTRDYVRHSWWKYGIGIEMKRWESISVHWPPVLHALFLVIVLAGDLSPEVAAMPSEERALLREDVRTM